MNEPANFNLLTKAIVYRALRITLLLIVALLVLGDITTALSISFIDAIIATIYYYYFDKIWDMYIRPKVHRLHIKIKYRRFKG